MSYIAIIVSDPMVDFMKKNFPLAERVKCKLPLFKVPSEESPTLEQLQLAVAIPSDELPGHIELALFQRDFTKYTIYCNDGFLYSPEARQPGNIVSIMPNGFSALMVPIAILKEIDMHGDSSALTDEDIAELAQEIDDDSFWKWGLHAKFNEDFT